MNKNRGLLIAGILTAVTLLVYGLLHGHPVQVLDPKGTIGHQERQLMLFALGLSVIVVLPVFIMLFWFAWRYRDTHPKKARYAPDWDHNIFLESIWWLVPGILILVLSVVAWRSSHTLDPFRPLAGAKPLTIQVIALDWKWLFIYPEQNIASVNEVRFPAGRPVTFNITADAPMNSFWIPQLGGQIYAMAGMSTQLNLQADRPGEFRGSSANISGQGFAGMNFTARASTDRDFNKWVKTVKRSPDKLSLRSYEELARPSQNNPPAYYAASAPKLYHIVIMKHMVPVQGLNGASLEVAR
ncbi:MAG TPA: ubiquinol oxidase subunit II [Candidatus Saccharimonadales bacterium]|nr:ubiquinol oxidase subunit II [Candidatus Saccharimonadales bacterium]